MSIEITSPANPRVKHLVELRKRRVRDTAGATLIEGHDELLLALEAGVRPRQLFYAPEIVRADQLDLARRIEALGAEIVTLSSAALHKASYRESPDGWLAVAANPERKLSQLDLGPTPLLLICEAIEKPGNLGAMVRTAEAAGVDAVIAASPVTDWGNPNVVRASKGTVFSVQVATATSDETVPWLRSQGIQIVVATPETPRLLGETDLRAATAIVVGAEHEGVSPTWLAAADMAARLPMAGRVNSLNVATSAAIFVYEAVRQRSTG